MPKKKTSKKPRADHYEEKVSINGIFEQVIGVSVKDADKDVKKKDEEKKPPEEKKKPAK